MKVISVESSDQHPLEDFSACVEHESWTRQQIEDYQARALYACRQYAYSHSPFYQRFHRRLMDRPLQELPVLTKAMMMEHFDELVTDRAIHLHEVRQYLAHADASQLFLDRYEVTPTSGSSGQPGIFLYDRIEGAISANTFKRCSYWAGVTPTSRAAHVAGIDAEPPIVIEGQHVPRLQIAATDPIDTLVRRLNAWQPDHLVGYSSIVSRLAHEQRQGRLHISPLSITCVADTLTSDMRRRIEETWQTRLFNVYGTTEGAALAAECSFHKGLHLFEDFSIIEIVDQENRPVPPGAQGDKVLLTVFFRRTQPLIRYEITDLVRTSSLERCPCGRPFTLIEAIEGRQSEVLYFPSLRGGEEGVSPYPFEIVFDTQLVAYQISGYQVVQEHDGLHIFLTGASDELGDEHVLDALQQMLIRRGVLVPSIKIHRVAELSRNASGKIPTLISHVPHHVG